MRVSSLLWEGDWTLLSWIFALWFASCRIWSALFWYWEARENEQNGREKDWWERVENDEKEVMWAKRFWDWCLCGIHILHSHFICSHVSLRIGFLRDFVMTFFFTFLREHLSNFPLSWVRDFGNFDERLRRLARGWRWPKEGNIFFVSFEG